MKIDRGIVREVIRLAKEAKTWIGSRGAGFTSVEKLGPKSLQGNPGRKALVEFVERLSDNDKSDLVALLWVGRGDFAPEDWAQLGELARARVLKGGSAAGYLTDKVGLAGFLEEGLARMTSSEEQPSSVDQGEGS